MKSAPDSSLRAAADGAIFLEPASDADASNATEHLQVPETTSKRFFWPYLAAFIVLHLLCLLAFIPWLFSWWGVASVFVGNLIFGAVGINLTYHRLLTHRGLVIPKWLERVFVTLGVCSLQDAPARWVGIHRMHHQHSDHRPDPHTPWVTFFWGHMGWLLWRNEYYGSIEFYDRYARDVIRDPYYRWLEMNMKFFLVYAIHAVVIFLGAFGIGWLATGQSMGGLQFGLSMLVWGVFVRTVYVWHITWAINSVSHMWGYRNYETRDHSTNNFVLALTNNGEGWHNNHHAHPRCAAHGHRWWEFDITYWMILTLERLGVARQVDHPKPHMLSGSEGE